MKNKEIQEKRMKEYFIQATKDILKGEGLKSLSVRNIADRAGYSYATLYNYFRDINDLVFLCVSDFQDECREYVADQSKNVPQGLDKMKADVVAYLNFFMDYPGIFDLFYLAKVGDFGNKLTTIEVIYRSLEDVCKVDWEYCINAGLVRKDELQNLRSRLKFAVAGLLLFYINRRSPETYQEFMEEANRQINSILV